MVWGFLRVSIFVIAFSIGVRLAGPDAPASSAPSSIPQSEEKVGTALVVSCETGIVTIKHLNRNEAVQFECARGSMVVVRDHSGSLQEIPELRLLRHQVSF
jgi:hypothetical protein